MKIRQHIILAIILATSVGAYFVNRGFKKAAESKKKEKPKSEFKIQTKVLTVQNKSYPAKVNFTGRVKSIDRIDLYAEVSGVLKDTRPRFKAGNRFKKGQILIKLDDTELRLQLTAKKSQFINTITKLIPDLKVDYPQDAPAWENYLGNLNPSKQIPALPKITNKKLVYFISGRNINDAYFDIKSQEAKLSKYTIYAPFNGIVKSSNITPGTLVRVGQSLGEFISTDGFELEASISFKDLKFLDKGQSVLLRSSDLEKDWKGEIYRIGNVINESTQTIDIYIRISGNDVKEGMYLKGGVDGKMIENAFSVPRLLLLPNEKLYVVTDGKLMTNAVDVVKVNSDEVILKGLTNGTQVVGKPISRGVIGTKVEVITD